MKKLIKYEDLQSKPESMAILSFGGNFTMLCSITDSFSC